MLWGKIDFREDAICRIRLPQRTNLAPLTIRSRAAVVTADRHYYFTGLNHSDFCPENFNDHLVEISAQEFSRTERHITVTFFDDTNSRSTKGDSGAPLYEFHVDQALTHLHKRAIGLLSGKRKIGKVYYMEFLNLYFFRHWIFRHTGIYPRELSI